MLEGCKRKVSSVVVTLRRREWNERLRKVTHASNAGK